VSAAGVASARENLFMQIMSTTIGIPVTDLNLAQLWYEAVFELEAPDLEPVDGIVEYQVGEVWLQLAHEESPVHAGVVMRFGVTDVVVDHARLEALGVDVSPIVHVEGAVDFFDVVDPDGTTLSFYTVVA
jgi:predicted enzyme related to lactoylglutathione lyase